MSSEPSMDTILTAINAVKAEVAGLAASVRSAEGRIARLEAATYTPIASPSPYYEGKPDQHALPEHQEPGTPIQKGPQPSCPEGTANQGTTEESTITGTPCTNDKVCDIQRHLQPVNEGIALLTSHLLRIESTINSRGLSGPPSAERPDNFSQTSTDSSSSGGCPIPPIEISEMAEEHTILEKQTTDPGESSKPRDGPTASKNFRQTPSAPSHPIFGQTSTPSRRVLSLNVSGSPWGQYVADGGSQHEQSPFGKLAKKDVDSSIMFPSSLSSSDSNKPSPLAGRLRGSARNSQNTFGTPGSSQWTLGTPGPSLRGD
ncbi:hypothetical protein BDV95DRAFT_605231 [Massariosphaeria phaeospora]|uniref:Uncharacterized protein n=1 Tax=Massariosphaeria phaeospora TaxID=100035 RepID=A0A7C8ICM5_9PLEO|nr:hypothetical protein BDV95DRAFT_605231 [Massariosphaeria phaeospora]